jgi:uncharacterized protein (TIGR03437 family)
LALGGVTVAFRQSDWPSSLPVPVQAVYPLLKCAGLEPSDCVPLLGVAVQIPWQLTPNFDRGGRPATVASLTVSYQGVSGEPFALRPEADAIHARTTCDSTMPPGVDPFTLLPGPCRALALREDGSPVTAAAPAHAGEMITLHVYGLGRTEDDLENGQAPSEPRPLTGVELGFQFGPNLPAMRPQSPQRPVAAMLSRDRVGLYEIKFTVPALPEDLPECTASTIVSNLTVTISGAASFDGAGICVAP